MIKEINRKVELARLFKSGKNTLVVSVPYSIVNIHELRSGDLINITIDSVEIVERKGNEEKRVVVKRK